MDRIDQFSVCRLCLCTSESLIDIFEESGQRARTVEDTIEEVLRFKVTKINGFPWLACSTCLEKLDDFQLFKNQCIEAKIAFEGRFPLLSHLKEKECHDVQAFVNVEKNDGEATQQKGTRDCPKTNKLVNNNYEEYPSSEESNAVLSRDNGEEELEISMDSVHEESSYEKHAPQNEDVNHYDCIVNKIGTSSVDNKDSSAADMELESQIANCDDRNSVAFIIGRNQDGKRKRKKKDLRYPNEPLSSSDEMSNADVDIAEPSSLDILVPRKTARQDTGVREKFAAISAVPVKVASSGSATKESLKVVGLQLQNSFVPIKTASVDSSTKGSFKKQCLISIVKVHKPEHVEKGVQVSDVGDSLAMMDLLASIKEEIGELKRNLESHIVEDREALESISRKLDSQQGGVEDIAVNEEVKNLHSFPVEDIEQLIELEATLTSNSTYRKYLISYLKERSSSILYKCNNEKQITAGLNKTVNDMCSVLISNELAVNFCMKGRSEGKIGFETHFNNVIDVIFESVKAKSIPGVNFDMLSIKRSMSEWFRVSRSRTTEGKLARRVNVEKQI